MDHSNFQLRPYQSDALDALRGHIRQGKRRLVLCAPTGAGKTVIASEMVRLSVAKGRRAAFLTETTALVRQTVETFNKAGIPHDVVWRDFGADTGAPVRVCMMQTLGAKKASREAERRWVEEADLIVIDECHVRHKSGERLAAACQGVTIGLSATPMSRSMDRLYDAVVNVRSTNQLITDGHLVGLKPYAMREMDLRNARVASSGEYAQEDVQQPALRIVGDVAETWAERTNAAFGGPVPTLVYAASLEHGAALQRAFADKGVRMHHVRDRDTPAERDAMLDDFESGRVTGLINCEVLGKGFDRPSVRCLIAARPYRKAFGRWAQQVGRGMRPAPDKDFCLLLDHCGNYARFQARLEAFYAVGHHDLANRNAPPTASETGQPCPACRAVPARDARICPECGGALAPKRSRGRSGGGGVAVVNVQGVAVKVGERIPDRGDLWPQCCAEGVHRYPTNQQRQMRRARYMYETLKQLPRGGAAHLRFAPARRLDPAVRTAVAAIARQLAKELQAQSDRNDRLQMERRPPPPATPRKPRTVTGAALPMPS